MRRLVLTAAALGAVLLGAVPASAFQNNPANGPTASADGVDDSGRCSPKTDRTITGTLLGADGLDVNATIGFDLTDGQGHTFDLGTGCKANGYSTVVQLNHGISGEGAPAGTVIVQPDGTRGPVSPTFTLRDIPADVVNAWIEVYPRAADPATAQCGWGCAGVVDTHKYGGLNRREVPIDGVPLDLRVPLTSDFGGTTGALQITVTDHGTPYTAPVKAYTWSMLTPEGSRPDQGWGFGHADGNVWTFPSLGSGQDYRARFFLDPDGVRYVEIQHVHVDPGKTNAYTLDVSQLTMNGGRGTLDLTTIPATAASVKTQGRSYFSCKQKKTANKVAFTCTFPKGVKKNTHADISYFARGVWTRFTVKQVDGHRKATLTGTMKYVGTQQWRIHAGKYTNSYVVTGT